MPCQQQTDGIDCGLFAIARILDYASGHRDLGSIYYDQSKMRAHFAQCLFNGYLTRFPLLNVGNVRKCGWKSYSIALMSCCLLPRSYSKNGIVKCVLCPNLHHIDCVGQSTNYICDKCMKALTCVPLSK